MSGSAISTRHRASYIPSNATFHVRVPPDNTHFNRYAVGIDHGTEHPGAMVLIGITGFGDDQIAWALQEHVASHRENCEWDAIARTHYSGMRGWADPSRPDRIADLRRAGMVMMPADNSVQAGISRVASLMFRRQEEDAPAWARFYVHPQCTHTIAELQSYARTPDPRAPGKYLDDVVKLNDDACDAIRYAIMGEFGPHAGNRRHEVNDA